MSDFINGMIFVCDEHTADDMFKYQIFGLPLTYLREMKLLVPGKSALFLLEKQTNVIRGIFVPTSCAKKLIVSDIWLHQDQCSYPSQIRFKLHSSYTALPKDSEFSPQFLRRMKVKGKFLDRSRVRSLIMALTSYQSAVKSNQARYRGLMGPSPSVLNRFSGMSFPTHNQMYPSHFDDYNSAYANLALLQQQNELLRLENQVLNMKMRKSDDTDLYRDGRDRADLLRTMNTTPESSFDTQFEFEKFKDFMLSSELKPMQGWKERDQYHKLPYNVNAMQHFKQQGYDENRTQWMKPEEYTSDWQPRSGPGPHTNQWDDKPTALIH